MARKLGIKGRCLDIRTPEWEPLVELADLHVADFMWMYAVELRDKTRIQVYKHYWTREYLHLDGDGRCFVFREPDRYQEIHVEQGLFWALDEDVLHKRECASWSLLEPELDRIEFFWSCPEEELGIARERVEFVVRHSGLHYAGRAPDGAVAGNVWRVWFFGDDQDGIRIQVDALDVHEDAYLVVRATEITELYDPLYARAKRWRR